MHSAAVLPWVHEDTRVEHRVHVGAERVLPLEVGLVHGAGLVHVVAMGFLISRAREKGFVTATLSAASTGSTSFHFDDLVRDKLVADFFFFKAVLNKHLDVS